jgi:hypothetical protein
VGHAHAPLWHVSPPVHAEQLAPQWDESLFVSQQPLEHDVNPPSQMYEQLPEEHIGIAFETDVVHAEQLAPQWSGSSLVFQQPPEHEVNPFPQV